MSFLEPGLPARRAERVRERFARTFGSAPTVTARAPGRVNLIGEHTDYNAGPCLPVALPHATYAAGAARADARVRIASTHEDARWQGRLSDLGPGAVTGWAAYVAGVLWALREAGLDVPGVDVLVDSTVPVGAGLSSSAAVECATAVAATALAGLPLDTFLRQTIAEACVRAETEVAGAPTGGMDQTVAMHARADAALLIDFGTRTTRQVPLPLDEAGMALLVVDTRVPHALVESGYGDRRADCEAAAASLGLPSLRGADLAAVEEIGDDRVRRRARHVVTEIDRVGETVAALRDGDWATVGGLLVASHVSLRDDFEVSCAELDTAVVSALSAGAAGARMTGAGFGGSAVVLVRRDGVADVVAEVDRAFAAGGHRPPAYLIAERSGAAGVVS